VALSDILGFGLGFGVASLPENVVSINTINTFKNRLHKFWSDQE